MARAISLAIAGFAVSEVERLSMRLDARDRHAWFLRVDCGGAEPDLEPRVFIGASVHVEARDQATLLVASGVVAHARRRVRRGARFLTLHIKPSAVADVAAPAGALPASMPPVDAPAAELLVEHSQEAFVELMVRLLEAPHEEVAILERFGVRGAGDRDRLLGVWRERWRADPVLLAAWRRLYDARRRRR